MQNILSIKLFLVVIMFNIEQSFVQYGLIRTSLIHIIPNTTRKNSKRAKQTTRERITHHRWRFKQKKVIKNLINEQQTDSYVSESDIFLASAYEERTDNTKLKTKLRRTSPFAAYVLFVNEFMSSLFTPYSSQAFTSSDDPRNPATAPETNNFDKTCTMPELFWVIAIHSTEEENKAHQSIQLEINWQRTKTFKIDILYSTEVRTSSPKKSNMTFPSFLLAKRIIAHTIWKIEYAAPIIIVAAVYLLKLQMHACMRL